MACTAGWLVVADGISANPVAGTSVVAKSGPDGTYQLNLTPGIHTIRETLLSGWTETAPVGGVYTVTVVAGGKITGRDFGNKVAIATATISGTVWNDLNGDGIREQGEGGLAGWAISAVSTNPLPVTGTPPVSAPIVTVSGADGSYQLTVPAGSYTIRETPQPGWQITAPATGSYSVTVHGGDAITGDDFGDHCLMATIAGTVWNDLNGNGTRDPGENGLAGWTISAVSSAATSAGAAGATAISGPDGSYQLTVPAGSYVIRELPRPGWQVTAPATGSYSVTVHGGDAVTGDDFGDHCILATISGAVWNDLNGDGIRETGENGLAGWTIYAAGISPQPVVGVQPASPSFVAVSGADGSYQLSVPAGTYVIRETPRPGWQVTAPTAGFYSVTVAGGGAVTGEDFGDHCTITPIAASALVGLNGGGSSGAASLASSDAARAADVALLSMLG